MELVRNTPGIIRTVSFGGKPQAVPDEEIDSLQRIVGVERNFCPWLYLSAGQKVRIITGPLAGITGIITKFRQRHRLVVSVDVVMQSVSIEVDQSEIELAESSA